jgi:hypothetical protein
MGAQPIVNYIITLHAVFEMERRGLDEPVIRSVLAVPEQRIKVRAGRDVLHEVETPLGVTNAAASSGRVWSISLRATAAGWLERLQDSCERDAARETWRKHRS